MKYIVLASILGLAACDSGADQPPISVEDFEAMVDDAQVCAEAEGCVVVDTYCCARAVAAGDASAIRAANDRLEDAEGECLADCIDPEQLAAECLGGTCVLERVGFCGVATEGACTVAEDCVTDGCSGEVCRSTAEDPVVTLCGYKECFDDVAYGVACGCVDGQCVWN